MKLEHRNGYYADKVFAKFNCSDKERQLQDALMLGDPVSELPLAIEIDHFRIGKDRYFVPISVKIPGSAINLAKKGTRESRGARFHRADPRQVRPAGHRSARRDHRQAGRGRRFAD